MRIDNMSAEILNSRSQYVANVVMWGKAPGAYDTT